MRTQDHDAVIHVGGTFDGFHTVILQLRHDTGIMDERTDREDVLVAVHGITHHIKRAFDAIADAGMFGSDHLHTRFPFDSWAPATISRRAMRG